MSSAKKKDLSSLTVSARSIIIPVAVSVIIIFAVMVIFVHSANTSNKKLAESLRDSAEYVEEISDFMGGVSLLNETSASFIVNPADGEGNVIWGQIMPYAVELGTGGRRAEDLLAYFAEIDVSDETMQYLNAACEDAKFFLDTQLHAIALVTSVYPLPEMPALEPIAHLEISEEEAQMPEGARLGISKSLILNEEYGAHRKSLAAAVNDAIRTVKESSSNEIKATDRKIGVIKSLLWVAVGITVAILAIAFIAIYRFLVYPLTKASKQFLLSEKMNENFGLKELRIAATSYNDLLERRDNFEIILKHAAETDVLTKLPNRYAFEYYIKSLERSSGIYPVCYYSFDLNYLKITNDTYGHLNGDILLESAARIIKSCFGDDCFRVGGDEFAAFIKNFDAKAAADVEKKFLDLQEKEGVSISFGSSVSNDLKTKTIDQMMVEADNMMYERKRILHASEEEKAKFAECAGLS